MSQPMVTITMILAELARNRQQFLNVQEGWEAFLDYLEARNGADIRGFNRMQDINELAEGLENGTEDIWDQLARFEAREDVQNAFRQFMRVRGLPLPERWPNS